MASGDARGARLLARMPAEPTLPPAAAPGAMIAVEGTFRHAGQSEPGEFDLASHLRSRGIAGELDVHRARLTGHGRGGLRGALDLVRTRALAAVGAGLPSPEASIARGMVLGADDDVTQSVREDFRDSGLAHLLAASGSNVALLCALALPLLIGAGLPRVGRAPVLVALIAVYVAVAGAGPSIQRAGVMGAATLLAIALARPASRWYALGLAACVTLTLDPRAWEEPGWQLSFAAVAGILVLGPGIGRALEPLPRLLADGIALTVAATVATAPLVAHHFGVVSLAGLPANVVALPLVAPIMWLGMLRAAVGQADVTGPLGEALTAADGLLGVTMQPLLAALVQLATLFADAPGGQLGLTLDGPLAVAAAYLVLALGGLGVARLASRHDADVATAVAYLRRLPRRRKAMLAVATGVAVVLVVARGLSPPGPPATLTVTFLDVGQGDATLIQHPDGSAVLFDGGPPEGGVARLLRRRGVRRLSALVMTHASRDHHGGLKEVVQRIPVDLLVDGGDGTRDGDFRAVVEGALDRGSRRIVATAPLTLRAGSLRIDVLSPAPRPAGPPPEDPNPRAVVAVVSCGGFAILLSGDAESGALLPLALPDVDALKLPHHGSADPGLGDVLERVRPELASIPVGENGYGHPAPSTLAALRDAGVPTWRTDRNGSVRVTVGDGGVRVEAERGGPVSAGP
jgi:competence protein ComEC